MTPAHDEQTVMLLCMCVRARLWVGGGKIGKWNYSFTLSNLHCSMNV